MKKLTVYSYEELSKKSAKRALHTFMGECIERGSRVTVESMVNLVCRVTDKDLVKKLIGSRFYYTRKGKKVDISDFR